MTERLIFISKLTAAVVSVATLSACVDRSATGVQSTSPASPAALDDRSHCPAKDFATFLEQYRQDVSVQRAFTHDPLITTRFAEPGEVQRETAAKRVRELVFPLIPSREDLARDGRQVRVGQVVEGMKVNVAKPDTGWTIDYTFKRVDGCWTLIRVDDWSI